MTDTTRTVVRRNRLYCIGSRTIVCNYLGPAETWTEGERWGWTCPSCGTSHSFTRPTWGRQDPMPPLDITPPKEMGEHVLYGITFVIGGLGSVRWRSDCAQCVRQGKGAFAPDHDAMPGCRSGGRDHCTCDGCF
jgi:hypothetical protein